jgi:hypothetical protein
MHKCWEKFKVKIKGKYICITNRIINDERPINIKNIFLYTVVRYSLINFYKTGSNNCKKWMVDESSLIIISWWENFIWNKKQYWWRDTRISRRWWIGRESWQKSEKY